MNCDCILSIVMPTYNRETEILISIKTILDTLPNILFRDKIELLVVDNASDYDMADVLKKISKLSEKKLRLRVVENKKTIGIDDNFLNGLCEANGKYILQCSDRYYYNIDFLNLLPLLENKDHQCIIFSDRFRKYTQTEITLNTSFKDSWLREEFNIIKESNHFFQIDSSELKKSNYLKSGLVNSFSDLIFPNLGKKEFQCRFVKFIGTYMLGVAVQLSCIKYSNSISIFRVSMGCSVHQNIGSGNLYNRHDYNDVYKGNLLLQQSCPFIGTEDEIRMLQIRGLMSLYLADNAGLYYCFIKPDKLLISSVVKEYKELLGWHDSVDYFFIKMNVSGLMTKYYLLFKRLYFLVRNELIKIKDEESMVKELKDNF